MQKILMLFYIVFTLSVPTTVLGDTQSDVKRYIHEYRQFLEHVQDGVYDDHMATENLSRLMDYNSEALTAAIEVLTMIEGGYLDDCCWKPEINEYTAPTATTDDMVNGAINGKKITFSYTSQGDGQNHNYSIPSSVNRDMKMISDSLDAYWNHAYHSMWGGTTIQKEIYDILNFMQPIFKQLKWTFSYSDVQKFGAGAANPMSVNFLKRYAFACVVCFGAGFYDTSLLHTASYDPSGKVIAYKATAEYIDLFVNNSSGLLSQGTIDWMEDMADEQFDDVDYKGHAPVQISMGPTYQGVSNSNIGNPDHEAHIYPAHCHGSIELYKTLPFITHTQKAKPQANGDIDNLKKFQDDVQVAVTQYKDSFLHYNLWDEHYSDYSWVTVPANVEAGDKWSDTMYPVWYSTQESPASNYYNELDLWAIFFNDSLVYHSMHNGKWMQFNQWARLTSPNEGTFFSLNDVQVNGDTSVHETPEYDGGYPVECLENSL